MTCPTNRMWTLWTGIPMWGTGGQDPRIRAGWTRSLQERRGAQLDLRRFLCLCLPAQDTTHPSPTRNMFDANPKCDIFLLWIFSNCDQVFVFFSLSSASLLPEYTDRLLHRCQKYVRISHSWQSLFLITYQSWTVCHCCSYLLLLTLIDLMLKEPFSCHPKAISGNFLLSSHADYFSDWGFHLFQAILMSEILIPSVFCTVPKTFMSLCCFLQPRFLSAMWNSRNIYE